LNGLKDINDNYGYKKGDEYIINTAFCQRIQKNIKEFNNLEKRVKALSISIGFEVMENNSQRVDEVFKKAAQKMYSNKRN